MGVGVSGASSWPRYNALLTASADADYFCDGLLIAILSKFFCYIGVAAFPRLPLLESDDEYETVFSFIVSYIFNRFEAWEL